MYTIIPVQLIIPGLYIHDIHDIYVELCKGETIFKKDFTVKMV